MESSSLKGKFKFSSNRTKKKDKNNEEKENFSIEELQKYYEDFMKKYNRMTFS